MRCSRCKSTSYCSSKCQTDDWTDHKRNCIPAHVEGIIINCERDRRHGGIFQPVDIPATHEIHRLGEIAPVSKAVGLPLVVYRHIREPWMARPDDASLDNQIATFLMIKTHDGFAAPEYQKQVGTITVMRKDGKPLTPEAIETIWMYHDYLLDVFGDDPALARAAITRDRFKRYCEQYKEESASAKLYNLSRLSG
ncbi:hypothetical protein Hypma_001239 [Hypsizygus marmoreus]|uniref:MYND-type domain-containing protein n=1 Tax=Hypsizygus marmoreus TaxID=39966 RepID=A0A369J6F4_HYPMA|nr:hypothetical protein Hypma_001239 [Hypsizygus marmoreus]